MIPVSEFVSEPLKPYVQTVGIIRSKLFFEFENDINAPIGRKEDVIKISAKNCKVNKAVIENVGNCFTKLKAQIKAVLLRCCLSFIIV